MKKIAASMMILASVSACANSGTTSNNYASLVSYAKTGYTVVEGVANAAISAGLVNATVAAQIKTAESAADGVVADLDASSPIATVQALLATAQTMSAALTNLSTTDRTVINVSLYAAQVALQLYQSNQTITAAAVTPPAATTATVIVPTTTSATPAVSQ